MLINIRDTLLVFHHSRLDICGGTFRQKRGEIRMRFLISQKVFYLPDRWTLISSRSPMKFLEISKINRNFTIFANIYKYYIFEIQYLYTISYGFTDIFSSTRALFRRPPKKIFPFRESNFANIISCGFTDALKKHALCIVRTQRRNNVIYLSQFSLQQVCEQKQTEKYI